MPKNMNTIEKFLNAVNGFSLGGGVLVALSGGADSVCLLNLFVNAQKEGFFNHKIAAAHLNHCLRGEESDGDERFCKEICEKLSVEFHSKKTDVNELAKVSGKGVEEAARAARYSFLQEAAKISGCLYVATAHHKGDVCETMLLNLARGASMDGLCSIPKVRDNIIRPLLAVSKEEILEYVEANGLSYVTDCTNADTKYSRNRVRLNILPEFKKIYAGYEDNFLRSAALLKRDADFLAAEAEKLYSESVKDGVLYTEKAQNVHISLLSRIVKKLYNYHGFCDLDEMHIDAVCQKIQSGDKNFTLSMHGCLAVCERGLLTFEKPQTAPTAFCIDIEIGETVTLPTGVCVTLSEKESDGAFPLKKAALCGKLSLSSRREGDTVTVFNKTHKVKRMISDKKLSSKEKAKLFFLLSDGKTVYSNLPLISDSAFARKGDGDCIFITVKDTEK